MRHMSLSVCEKIRYFNIVPFPCWGPKIALKLLVRECHDWSLCEEAWARLVRKALTGAVIDVKERRRKINASNVLAIS